MRLRMTSQRSMKRRIDEITTSSVAAIAPSRWQHQMLQQKEIVEFHLNYARLAAKVRVEKRIEFIYLQQRLFKLTKME